MNYVKRLGLLAMAAATLTAFAGTASADQLTSTPDTTFTGTIKASSEGSTYFTGPWSAIKCEESLIEGKVTAHGPGGKAVMVEGTTLHFAKCNYIVTVLQRGTLMLVNAAAGATVTSINTVLDLHTSVGRCRLATGAGTHIGQLTDTDTTGGHATFDIDNSKIPVTEGNFFCGSSVEWESNYTVTSPTTLYVDAS